MMQRNDAVAADEEQCAQAHNLDAAASELVYARQLQPHMLCAGCLAMPLLMTLPPMPFQDKDPPLHFACFLGRGRCAPAGRGARGAGHHLVHGPGAPCAPQRHPGACRSAHLSDRAELP